MQEHKLWHNRGYLPHFDEKLLIQFITFRLADSLPQSMSNERWENLSAKQKIEKQNELELQLDRGAGSCLLRKAEFAEIVEDQMLRYDRDWYRLIAWVVMPNHVHALIETFPGFSLSSVLHRWKGSSSFSINRLHGSSGRLWQPEYFDRYIRNEEHLLRAVNYIELNPVKAGLTDAPEKWRFSSAGRKAGAGKGAS